MNSLQASHTPQRDSNWGMQADTVGCKLGEGKGLREGWDSKELWKGMERPKIEGGQRSRQGRDLRSTVQSESTLHCLRPKRALR